jgi:hypothetical protein
MGEATERIIDNAATIFSAIVFLSAKQNVLGNTAVPWMVWVWIADCSCVAPAVTIPTCRAGVKNLQYDVCIAESAWEPRPYAVMHAGVQHSYRYCCRH